MCGLFVLHVFCLSVCVLFVRLFVCFVCVRLIAHLLAHFTLSLRHSGLVFTLCAVLESSFVAKYSTAASLIPIAAAIVVTIVDCRHNAHHRHITAPHIVSCPDSCLSFLRPGLSTHTSYNTKIVTCPHIFRSNHQNFTRKHS